MHKIGIDELLTV